MRRSKARITITLDRDQLRAIRAAVRSGRADSVSGFVSGAVARETEALARLEAGRAAVAAYEAEFGAFTHEELERHVRLDRARATRVRARRTNKTG